jgi:hypothetical protein
VSPSWKTLVETDPAYIRFLPWRDIHREAGLHGLISLNGFTTGRYYWHQDLWRMSIELLSYFWMNNTDGSSRDADLYRLATQVDQTAGS